MQYLTDEIPGSKRSTTPEGFMVCRDVPLARTGMQVYADYELPDLISSADGLVLVQRDASEVFRPESIDSLNGKPVTVEHPGDEEVTPDNIAQHQVGFVVNARRGSKPQDSVVLGDLVITHRKGLDALRAGIRGVSVGYQCSYTQDAPGRARQYGIVANHVALTDSPRCGATCMIGDSAKPVAPAKQKARDAALRTMGVTPQQIELRHRHEQLRVRSAAVLRSINAANRAYYHGR